MSYQQDRITGIPAPLPKDYDRQTNFTDYQTANPGKPIRGTALDAEFNVIEQAMDETQARLRLIQRDDGALANRSVGLDQLTQEAQIGVNAPTDWEAFTQYNASDSVIIDGGTWYICLESHISSNDFQADLSAGKWRELINLTPYTTEAKNWATYPEDDPVPEGDGSQYSALHHAAKALAAQVAANLSAQSASNSATQTAADRVQTGQDAAQTAADRVQTGQDRTAASNAATTATNKLTEFQGQYYGALASDPTEDPNGDPPGAGDLYFSTTAPVGLRGYDADAGVWRELGNNFQGFYDRRDYTVGAGGEDTFAVTYEGSLVDVLVNGALLPRADYTATSGTDVVLGETLPEGTEVTVIGIGKFDVADISNAVVTSASGTQSIGDALDARVPHVPDIAALRALTGVQDGQRVSVTGYHPGSSIGGGEFYYDASRPKVDHNGGTVISPTVPWDGSQAALSDFLNGVGETDAGGSGCFVSTDSMIITPHMFGAKDGTECGAALQKFFDAFNVYASYGNKFDVSCDVLTDQALSLSMPDDSVLRGYARIRVNNSILDSEAPNILTLDGTGCSIEGGFFLSGYTSAYSTKKALHGLYLNSWSRGYVRSLKVVGVEGFGVIFDAATNDNISTFDFIKTQYCGYKSGRQRTRAFTFVGFNNSRNSTTREMVINCDLSDIRGNNRAIRSTVLWIDDSPHVIRAYDTETHDVTIYPGFDDGWTTADSSMELDPIFGGGVSTEGGNSGEVMINALDAMHCGVCIQDAALYGIVCHRLVAQSSGIGYMAGNGNRITSVNGNGTDLVQPYFEAMDAVVLSVGTSSGAAIKSGIGFGTRIGQVWSLQPPGLGVGSNGTGRFILSGFTDNPGGGKSGRFDLWPAEIQPGSSSNIPSDHPSFEAVDYENEGYSSRIVTLTQPTNYWARFPVRRFQVYGRQSGYFAISRQAGYTINGMDDDIEFPGGVPDGTAVTGILRGTDWRVTVSLPNRPLTGSSTYDPPEIADGASETTTVTVTGAALGDFARASFGADLQGVTLDAWVSAVDTVSVKFTNSTGSTVDLVSATLRARVEKA